MYENAVYKILISIYLLVYLYLISYNLIISNKKNYNTFTLNVVNLISVCLFLLGYRIYESESVYIQNQTYQVYFLLEQFCVGILYLFMIGLCKPYLKIDWKYKLYIFIFPLILISGALLGYVNIGFMSNAFFSDYDRITSLVYDNSMTYTSTFYSVAMLSLIIKVIIEKINVSKSYKKYYASYLLLFMGLIVYEFYVLSNILSSLDLIFFYSTIVVLLNIITFNYVNESNLALSRDHVFNKLSTAYVMIDSDGNVIDYNTKFEENLLLYTDKADRTNLNNILGYFNFETLKEYEGDYILTREINDRTNYYVSVFTDLIGEQEEQVGKLVEFIEISDKIELIKRQSELLNIDELTGLYSRRYYYDVIDSFNKKEFLPLCFISMDINNLKVVNDTFGHKFGDKYLVTNSKAVKDLLPQNSVIARVGGDEIVAIIPNCKNSLVREILENIERMNSEVTIKPFEKVDISIGYAMKTELNQDSDDILTKADENMYIHKAKNKKGRQ